MSAETIDVLDGIEQQPQPAEPTDDVTGAPLRKRRLAVYVYKTGRWGSVVEASDYLARDADYTRASDWIDVEFPPLTEPHRAVEEAVTLIEREKAKLQGEYLEKLAKLDTRKAELLALPAPAAKPANEWPRACAPRGSCGTRS